MVCLDLDSDNLTIFLIRNVTSFRVVSLFSRIYFVLNFLL